MPAGGSKRGPRLRAELDWPAIHRELKRKHVTSGTNTSPPIRAGTARSRRRCRQRCGKRMRLHATARDRRRRAKIPAGGGGSPPPFEPHRAGIRTAREVLMDWDRQDPRPERQSWMRTALRRPGARPSPGVNGLLDGGATRTCRPGASRQRRPKIRGEAPPANEEELHQPKEQHGNVVCRHWNCRGFSRLAPGAIA